MINTVTTLISYKEYNLYDISANYNDNLTLTNARAWVDLHPSLFKPPGTTPSKITYINVMSPSLNSIELNIALPNTGILDIRSFIDGNVRNCIGDIPLVSLHYNTDPLASSINKCFNNPFHTELGISHSHNFDEVMYYANIEWTVLQWLVNRGVKNVVLLCSFESFKGGDMMDTSLSPVFYRKLVRLLINTFDKVCVHSTSTIKSANTTFGLECFASISKL